MLIQPTNLQNLPQEMQATRRVKDTAQLEARISEVWLQLQQDKGDLKQSKLAKHFTLTTPEQDLENILLQLQTGESEVLEKYPELEKTEISLLVFESLMSREPSRVYQLWMQVFQEVKSHWQHEVGRTAEKLFFHLLRQGNSCALELLESVWRSLSPDYRWEWISHCADLATSYQEFYEALPCSGETAAAKLRRELSYRKYLQEEKIEGYEDLQAILDGFELSEPAMWIRLLEKVAESKFTSLKQEAWKFWLNQSKNDQPFEKVWLVAIRLLKEVDVKDAFIFYKSPIFAKLITFAEIYDPVYLCARKSSEDFFELVVIHQGFMDKYSRLREKRASSSLAKLNGNGVVSPTFFNGILDDLEQGIIGGFEVWCKVLGKVEMCKFPDIKKRTWGIWLLHYSSLKKEKTYGKIWQEAMKLMEAEDGVEFFCGPNFAPALQTLIKSNALISIYKNAANIARKSAADIPRILKAHQTYIDACPVLKNPVIFETALQLINECLKSNQLIAYQLIQHYTKDPQADQQMLTRACQWLQERLKGEVKKAIIPAAQELAEVLLELSVKNPEAINCYAMAEKLNVPGFYDLALRFVFKALQAAANEKKASQKQLDACFDLLAAILPKGTDSGILNFLKMVKIKEYQNSYSQKMQEKWIKELALRSLKIPSEGLMFVCDVWKILKNSLETAEMITEILIEKTVEILETEVEYTKLCTKIVNTLQEKVTYKMGDDGYRMPVLRPLDVFVGHFGMLAEREQSHSFFLLTIACNFVKDSERLKDFMETKIASVLANSCLKQVKQITDSDMMDTPDVQSFLHAASELLDAMKMDEDKKDLNSLTAIYAPAIYQSWLDVVESDDFSFDFTVFNEKAYAFIRENGSLAVKKLVWKFAVKFAAKHDEEVEEEIWVENLKEWMKLLDVMLAAGVDQNRVSLSHLNDVIEICDFAAPLLSKLALDYCESDLRDETIAALLKMADLQINYRTSTPEKKKEVLIRIVKIAIDDKVSTACQERILQFAMDAKRKGPRSEMPNGVKIDVEATDDDPQLKRKGVTDLFHYLLKESVKHDSFNALMLASELLKMGCFQDFQNSDHCDEMLQIFSDVMLGMEEYEESQILEHDIFRNIFYGLVHKTGFDEFNSLEELIGTQNGDCRKKAQKRLNEIIANFLKLCGENGEHLSKVSTKRRLLCISSFDEFLGDCAKKRYLEPEDLEKWNAQFALLK